MFVANEASGDDSETEGALLGLRPAVSARV